MDDLRKMVLSALAEVTGQTKKKADLPDTTPVHQLGLDSMGLFSVLLAIEDRTGGDITALAPDTPPPETLGGLVRLAARIGGLEQLVDSS